MAKKSRTQRKAARSAPACLTPREEVDRLIATGRVKDALKEAKICFRDQPSAEHRQLLERVYLLRTQQLRQGGMLSTAAEMAGHLLNFGVTDPDVLTEFVLLLPEIGLGDKARSLSSRISSP